MLLLCIVLTVVFGLLALWALGHLLVTLADLVGWLALTTWRRLCRRVKSFRLS